MKKSLRRIVVTKLSRKLPNKLIHFPNMIAIVSFFLNDTGILDRNMRERTRGRERSNSSYKVATSVTAIRSYPPLGHLFPPESLATSHYLAEIRVASDREVPFARKRLKLGPMFVSDIGKGCRKGEGGRRGVKEE